MNTSSWYGYSIKESKTDFNRFSIGGNFKNIGGRFISAKILFSIVTKYKATFDVSYQK
ncbi:MAG: hypothetical protein ACI3XX_03750 [Eubacteriales bacterium]